jgi:GTP-binding protein
MRDDSRPENRVVHAAFVAGATSEAGLPAPALAEIAFGGRSNVGKSSLMNALMQRKRLVRTSNTPGRTREVNVFVARLADGLEVSLVDLPGYGYAKVAKSEKRAWGPMMEDYLANRPTLRAVVVLVDVRRGVLADDLELVDFVARGRKAQTNRPPEVILVATKIDKVARAKHKPEIAKIEAAAKMPVIGFSAETGDGRDALWRRIRRAL